MIITTHSLGNVTIHDNHHVTEFPYRDIAAFPDLIY